jgi:outer membrane protein assembly factor BamB
MTTTKGRIAPLGITLCLLAACGGGGGSAGTGATGTGGGGTGDSGVAMSLSTSSVSETATTDQSAPVASFQVFANGLTTGQQVYIDGKYSENGIASMSAGTGSSPVTLSIQFKSPQSLGVGVYQDTVSVSVCYDQACSQPVTNSPQNVAVTYTVSQAAPQVSSLYPTGAAAGSAGFTLQVDGSNFTPQSVVEWNGSSRETAFVSATQITAQIAASDIAQPGNDAVTVSDPSSGGSVSNSLNFNVAGPSINSLTPSTATADSPGFTLTVNGSNFTSSSVVEWAGAPLTTTYSSPNVLTAVVPTADLATSGSVPVTVAVSAGSQALSSPQSFLVQPLATLSLDSISPTTVYAGGPAFNLTVLGQGYTASSAVQWNGSPRTTTYVSTDELLAQIQPSDIATAGTVSVTVQNPAAQGGTSSAQTLTIAQPLSDAVAFQINPQHSGAVSFNSVTLPPPGTWTSPDLGGTPSYALIANGKVYLTVSAPSGSELVALDRSTGAIVGGPVAISGATNAAYDNGSVFVISAPSFGAAQIQAYAGDLSSLEWSTLLTGQYAFSSAPTAADGFVFTGGAGSGGTLYAVPEATGGIAWTQGVANGDDSTPAVTADGVYVVYPCSTYDFRPATGEVIWTSNTGCDGGGGGTPVAANGVLYAPNGFGSYSGMTFDAETGATLGSYAADNPPAIGAQTGYFLKGGTLEAITLSSNTIVWSFAGDGQLTTSPILVSTPTNSYVFIGSASGMLYGLDAATGAVVWSVNVGAAFPAGAGWGAGLPLSGLSAGDGLLVVPAGTKVIAYALD